ncbi:MAG: hypothetical protein PHD05_00595 [Sphaerochaetaceae bacterium]|nr:hypothetical protein [Sphaerochaetaceae bacterium]
MYGFDWDTDIYDLKYNRSVIGTDLAMQASVGATNILKLSQGGTSTSHYAYIDVLVVCTNCNPFAVLDTGSIGEEISIISVFDSGISLESVLLEVNFVDNGIGLESTLIEFSFNDSGIGTDIVKSIVGQFRIQSTNKLLGKCMPEAGTLTTLYTVPESTQTNVNLFVCNQSGTSDKVDIALSSESLTDADYIMYNQEIKGYSTKQITGIALAESDFISVMSLNGNIIFVAIGMEIP